MGQRLPDEGNRMHWMKIGPACKYLGGVNKKVVYAAVRNGQLKAGRIGAGRNLRFTEPWLDEWLSQSARHSTPKEIRAVPRPAAVKTGTVAR
jgi:excisionase family DNA binding protein